MPHTHPYISSRIAHTHTWLTPPDLLNALGPFDLDPCAAPEPRPWPTAARHITLPDDGLKALWSGRIWCNPPYGSLAAKWLERMAEHGNGIALTFARTETRMFQKWVWPHATAILFIAGRPHFHYPDGKRAKGASGGSMCLIAYGEDNRSRLARSGIPGAFLRLNCGP